MDQDGMGGEGGGAMPPQPPQGPNPMGTARSFGNMLNQKPVTGAKHAKKVHKKGANSPWMGMKKGV